jgi:5-methylcytosine-specific restriction endonuclease McrA
VRALPPPTAQEQLRFLSRIQRLLSEGSFVASYKYALLHAIADLAVVRGTETGDTLELGTREIAGKMVELYWRQAVPFPVRGGEPVVLRQNKGSQAAILNRVLALRNRSGGSLARARRDRGWAGLLNDAESVLIKMPLWKLQTVAGERLDFLYANLDRNDVQSISLRSGVAYCLRAFHPLLTDLIRGAWLRYVRATNLSVIGEASDLDAFLFGTERSGLGEYLPLLRELQHGSCFYCRGAVRARAEIDHFVPWSLSPVDLAHNFVLAHRACNAAKSAHLAAVPHLDRWLERNDLHDTFLRNEFDRNALLHDRATSNRITEWAYQQAERVGARVWVARGVFRPLDSGWARLFVASNKGSDTSGRFRTSTKRD